MASCMIARALNCDGLNCWAKLSYSAIGMLHSSRIHSASWQIVPSGLVYSPSRNEYAPKWMNMPNRSLRHQDVRRSEEHTSELQSRPHLVCRLLLEKKKKNRTPPLFIKKKTKYKKI